MRLSYRRVSALALCLTLFGCSSSDSRFAELDATMEAFLDEQGLAGATAIVVHRDLGVLHEKSYGEFALDRVSLIASSGKIISVGVLMRLADQGLLDLDAPISTYLGEWGDFKTDVTVAQLLSNSSGLLGLTDDPLYGPYLCQYLSTGTTAGCAKSIYTADDAETRVAPDTRFRYGGGAWQLAGGVAEQVSGKTWEQLVAETYAPCELDVLGFTNQYMQAFLDGGDVGGALGYPGFFSGDISTLPVTSNPSIEGGSYTTVGDYGALLLMHLREGVCPSGRVLSAESVARMQEDRIAEYGGVTIDPGFAGYGLGWWVSRDEPGVLSDRGAYGAMPWIDTKRGYGVMIILEGSAEISGDLYADAKPIVERIVDELVATTAAE